MNTSDFLIGKDQLTRTELRETQEQVLEGVRALLRHFSSPRG